MKLNFNQNAVLVFLLAFGFFGLLFINSGARISVDIRHPISRATFDEFDICEPAQEAAASGDVVAAQGIYEDLFSSILNTTIGSVSGVFFSPASLSFGTDGGSTDSPTTNVSSGDSEYIGDPEGEVFEDPSYSDPDVPREPGESYSDWIKRKYPPDEEPTPEDEKELAKEIEDYLESAKPVDPASGEEIGGDGEEAPIPPEDSGSGDEGGGGGGALSAIGNALKFIAQALTGGAKCNGATVAIDVTKGGGEDSSNPGQPNPVPEGTTHVGVTVTLGSDNSGE